MRKPLPKMGPKQLKRLLYMLDRYSKELTDRDLTIPAQACKVALLHVSMDYGLKESK